MYSFWRNSEKKIETVGYIDPRISIKIVSNKRQGPLPFSKSECVACGIKKIWKDSMLALIVLLTTHNVDVDQQYPA